MSPHRSHSRGTFVIDLMFPPPIGRIRRASGTTDTATFKDIRIMLKTLRMQGRGDLLTEVKLGRLDPLHLLGLFRQNRLEEIPIGATLPKFEDAVEAWIKRRQLADDLSDEHERSMRKTLKALKAIAADLRLHQVPGALAVYREVTAGKQRTFNIARSHCQAILRAELGQHHPLYAALQDLEPFKRRRRKPRLAIEVADVLDLLTKLSPAAGEIAWALFVTGMLPKEYFVDGWSIGPDRIHVGGRKRESRERDIPFVSMIAEPRMSRRRWEKDFHTVAADRWTPKDLRNGFSHLLEAAGIPRSRRKWYMGHSAGDVTDGYEAHQVTAFLRQDAELIQATMGPKALQRLRAV